ncbi:MAG: hypothetical protein ACQERN_03855 [Thermodesulfobacteriota bacterium]
MKTKQLILFFLGTLLCAMFVAACTTGAPEKPEWFYNPNKTGKPGGIGISGPHVKGVNAQRDLAIQRAVDELARQMGVKVQNISKITRSGNRNRSSAQQKSYSIHTVEGQTIAAEIEELWHNPETNELYVWMVLK